MPDRDLTPTGEPSDQDELAGAWAEGFFAAVEWFAHSGPMPTNPYGQGGTFV